MRSRLVQALDNEMDGSETLLFEHFSLERDRKLYLDGYVEAYQQSFPGAPCRRR